MTGRWGVRALLVAAVLGGCGGIAIIDEPLPSTGSGGAGGDDGPDLCVRACDALSPCGITATSCINECRQITPGCEEPREAFLSCLVERATDVCGLSLCYDQVDSYVQCLNVFTSSSCGTMSETCTCVHSDAFGNDYAFNCFGSQDYNCTCSLNGEEVGQCSDSAAAPCGFGPTCCTAVVFVRGFP